MENRKDNLPLDGPKKELYNRLKATMQKEAQGGVAGGTRRGFLGTLLSGGVAVLGFGAAMTTQHAMARACGNSCINCLESCETDEKGCSGCHCGCEDPKYIPSCGNCQDSCETGCYGSPCVNINVVPCTGLELTDPCAYMSQVR